MNFFGILLFPLTVLYDAVTRFRNHLYDSGYKHSFSFDTNVIAVGNLSVGGTGKSPLVEYIIRLLEKRKLVTLSRGYGRKTKGFRLATKDDSPNTIGDEPYQFFNKFKHISVAVGEERAIAIPFILAELPETEVILLDDAYQHRSVKPDLNILLTDHNKPFFKDYVLPSGRLRESRKGAERADIVVVTKCPAGVDYSVVEKEIRAYNKSAPIAFTNTKYLEPQMLSGSEQFCDNVFLFSGIANPKPLQEYLSTKYNLVGTRYYKDHHHYTVNDLKALQKEFNTIKLDKKCLLTTEKDMVKLLPLLKKVDFNNIPLFYLPIEMNFIKGGEKFNEMVLQAAADKKNP